ncbi:hypothetical protein P1P68_12625 [Streptomyces scabiei]|nr:hypothetical protein [Streptomyces scabiei]MDW8805603.1 hypothetical protein [Streptomyces scabiei]
MPHTTTPAPVRAEDACVLCGYWRCRCDEVLRTHAHTHAAV